MSDWRIDVLEEIIGKRVKGIIIKESLCGQPVSQVFLIFDDDLGFEIWSSDFIKGADGLDPGRMEAERRYMKDCYRILVDIELDKQGNVLCNENNLYHYY